MQEIILASSSPRKKELLQQLIGDNFTIIESDYEENNNLNLLPDQLVKTLALGKARDVAKKAANGIIIAADCLVFYNGEALGKPYTEGAAKEMLQKIRGKKVSVITGIAVILASAKEVMQDHEEVIVHMANYSDEDIENYIATGEPMDKAGAFAIQEKGIMLVEKIEGDYTGVIGLPLYKLSRLLKHFDLNVFSLS